MTIKTRVKETLKQVSNHAFAQDWAFESMEERPYNSLCYLILKFSSIFPKIRVFEWWWCIIEGADQDKEGFGGRIFTTACHQQVILFEDEAGNILVNKVPALRVQADAESDKFAVIELPNDADFGDLFKIAVEIDRVKELQWRKLKH